MKGEKVRFNEIERYEIVAHAFREMTGMMAPGKDVAPGAFEEPYERREEAWIYWNHHHWQLVTALLDAVCHVMPDEDA
jgi:hypothetical protein